MIIVALPIEVKSRELLPKSILAYHLVRHGSPVLIGGKTKYQSFVLLFKTYIIWTKVLQKQNFLLFKSLSQSGFTISAFCEEGLGYRSPIQYVNERIYLPSKYARSFLVLGKNTFRIFIPFVQVKSYYCRHIIVEQCSLLIKNATRAPILQVSAFPHIIWKGKPSR